MTFGARRACAASRTSYLSDTLLPENEGKALEPSLTVHIPGRSCGISQLPLCGNIGWHLHVHHHVPDSGVRTAVSELALSHIRYCLTAVQKQRTEHLRITSFHI